MRDSVITLLGSYFEMSPMPGCSIDQAAEAAVMAHRLFNRVRTLKFNGVVLVISDDATAECLAQCYRDITKT